MGADKGTPTGVEANVNIGVPVCVAESRAGANGNIFNTGQVVQTSSGAVTGILISGVVGVASGVAGESVLESGGVEQARLGAGEGVKAASRGSASTPARKSVVRPHSRSNETCTHADKQIVESKNGSWEADAQDRSLRQANVIPCPRVDLAGHIESL